MLPRTTRKDLKSECLRRNEKVALVTEGVGAAGEPWRAVPDARIVAVCITVGFLSCEDEGHLGADIALSVELKLSARQCVTVCHETCERPQSCEKQGLSRSFHAIMSSWDP